MVGGDRNSTWCHLNKKGKTGGRTGEELILGKQMLLGHNLPHLYQVGFFCKKWGPSSTGMASLEQYNETRWDSASNSIDKSFREELY